MCFLIFHNEKHLCREGIKTRTSKSKKIELLPKGEVHGFGGKLVIFATYFLRQYIPGKMCFKILWNEKTNFQGYKIEKSKKSKNGPFSKGLVHGFGPKLTISQPFYFRQKRPGKCVSRYYGTQKPTLKAIKLRSPKSRKMDVFPKVLVHGFGPKLPISSRFYFSRYRPGKCVL